MIRQILPAAALCVAATNVMAQSLPQGFYLRGIAQADYLFEADPNRDFQNLDLSFGYDGSQTGGLPLTFDLGVKGFHSGKGDLKESVLYGSIGWVTSMGKFSAGAPRPVTSEWFRLPRVGGSSSYAAFAGTAVTTTDTLALYDSAHTVGLRYDYTIDDVTVGLSYHDFTDNSAATIVGLVAWESGPFTVVGGFEHVNADNTDGTDLSARIAYDDGYWGASAMYSTTSVIETETFAIDAFYALREDVRFNASYASFDVGDESSSVYGVSAEYIFPTGAYVGVGIADSDILDLDAGYNAYLGWKLDY